MPDTALNGNFVRTGLLLAVATGFGWFLYSRTGASRVLANGARDLRRSLRQGLDDAGEIAEGLASRVRSLTGQQPARRVHRRKIAVEEPMAGYGA